MATKATERRSSNQSSVERICQNVPVGLCYLDTDLRFIWVNEWLAAINGIPVEEHLGRTVREVIPDVAAGIESQLRHVIETGQSILDGTVEAVTAVHPGEKRFYQHNYDAVKSGDGRIIGVSCVVQDISERKRAEKALQESAEWTRLIVDRAHDAFIAMNADGRITDWNSEAENIFGWSRVEALKRPLASMIIPERYRKAHTKGLKHIMTTGEGPVLNKRLELSALHRDGHEFPVELSITAIRHGETITFAAFVHDITERKRAEEEITELASIVEFSNVATISATPEGNILSWNEAAERMYGYSAEEIKSRPMSILFPGGHSEELSQFVNRLNQGERSTHFETVCERKDGKIINISAILSPLSNTAGKITGFSALARDITERKCAEAVIEQLRRQNELILNAAGEGIYGLDLNGNTTFANPAAAKMIGWKAEELIGKPHHSILHHSKPDGTPYPREDCPSYAAFQDRSVHHLDDEVFWRKDGSSFPVEYISTPMLDEKKQLVGAVVTFRDISERKRAEEALQQSEERFRQVTENITEVFWVIDLKNYQILYISPSYEKIWGRSCKSLYEDPSTWTDAIYPEDRQRVLAAFEKQLRLGNFEEEYRIVQPDGSVRWIWDRGFPVRNQHGDVYRSVGIAQDVTDRKRAESELVNERANLELKVQERTQELTNTNEMLKTEINQRMLVARTLRKTEEKFRTIVESSPDAMVIVDREGRIQLVNSQVESVFGYHREELLDKPIETLVPERVRTKHVGHFATYTSAPHLRMMGKREMELIGCRKDGSEFPIEVSLSPLHTDEGLMISSNIRDITERKRAEKMLQGQNQVLKLLAKGETISNVLNEIAIVIEEQIPEAKCSILKLDDDGVRLLHLAAPSLPPEYTDAIDGITIGPTVGSCGTAAYLEKRVIVTDIRTDPLWTDYRQLAERFGLRACWSEPIRSKAGQILGTFAVYYDHPSSPSDLDIIAIESAAHLTAVALEYFKNQEGVQNLSGRLIHAQEEERSRIARELHDDVSQGLALISVELETLQNKPVKTNDIMAEKIRSLLNHTMEVATDVHRLSYQLHPAKLKFLGLSAAIRSYCNELSKKRNLTVELLLPNNPITISFELSLCLYRIVQESMQNIIKHSGASRAFLEIRTLPQEIQLIISDSGSGFDFNRRDNNRGLGIVSMQERLRLVGGKFSIQSNTSKGTRVEARIPLSSAATE